ncbi:hypothetical protein [Kosakonia radicincitans]|uniref:hypothetical protein n=1 Tax=Kosakonia radicincitans TaxID=283686 RepID=UPI001D07DFD6|nr:hypothetical protein [Kosakonia radicincitans]
MESTVNDFVAEQKKEIVRDKSLDVAKGLLMASVVAGHIAYFPFAEMFYYYHVAGFFYYLVFSSITINTPIVLYHLFLAERKY